MSANTKIEWADHTFNPWIGCTKVSPGCDHCYAEAWDRRFAVSGHAMRWGAGVPRTRTGAANWRLPLKWNAQAEREGRRFRVFCASLADVFDNEVPAEWRRDLLRLISATQCLDWLLLTKRIGNAHAMLRAAAATFGMEWSADWRNVWIGATVVNQDEADRDIPKLLAVPAAKRFLSLEPLLGPVDLRLPTRTWGDGSDDRRCNHCCNGDRCDDPTHYERRSCPHCRGSGKATPFDWVIVGGESGPHARPMYPDWVRSLRDQCTAAGVAFHFKQWGEYAPNWFNDDAGQKIPGSEWIGRMGKKAAGRILDGRTWDEVPF